MSIRRPISDTVCAFQKNEIGHFCLYPSISWVFPLNTEFRITSISIVIATQEKEQVTEVANRRCERTCQWLLSRRHRYCWEGW